MNFKKNTHFKLRVKPQALILAIVFFVSCHNSVFALDCGDDANPALVTLCDIIMFLQGRIGRSLVLFVVMIKAWEFVHGSVKWQDMLVVAIGIGLFFAPVTFAVWLLPAYIDGISGDGYDPTIKYTPAEIIQCACPNLR